LGSLSLVRYREDARERLATALLGRLGLGSCHRWNWSLTIQVFINIHRILAETKSALDEAKEQKLHKW